MRFLRFQPGEWKWRWWRKLSRREWLLLGLLATMVVALWGRNWFWRPKLTVRTDHYVIYSTANPTQTDLVARCAEEIFRAHVNLFSNVARPLPNPIQCKMKLYGSREEMRKCHPLLGWAEAFYRRPYAYAYYSATETAPYQWMVHELVHQLNNEVAQLKLVQWLDEGIAEYFSTSLLAGAKLRLGKVDAHTYPVWWLGIMAKTGAWATDVENGSIISLRTILSGRGGPAMRQHFNLYYLHWWTLTHFLFEHQDGKYRSQLMQFIPSAQRIEDFERLIGPVDQIQADWYQHVLQLKKQL